MKRPARTDSWRTDLCTCGHVRGDHKLLPRAPWPTTARRYGGCRECACTEFDVDASALAAAENASRAARADAWRADPLSKGP